MKSRPAHSVKFFLPFAITLFACVGCQNPGPYLPNPTPPYSWYPFHPHPRTASDVAANRTPSAWEAQRLVAEAYANRHVTAPANPACPTAVTGLTVNLTKQITGGLKFNQGKRMRDIGTDELNGNNTTLGGVYKSVWGVTSEFYKYEVVAVYNNLAEAIYGQMITPPATGAGKPRVEFEDDSPRNDWSGLKWNLTPPETKADFPILEVQGNTVRWIDAPQATTLYIPGTRFVMVYAGACGIVTHLQIVEITYNAGAPPTARTLTPAQFTAAVAGWTFKP